MAEQVISDWLAADEIETASGGIYNFNRPDPKAIKIEDVAHALSNLCRFNGHTDEFYSVAEHSILVADLLKHHHHSKGMQYAGLLHDAQEAYTGDYPRPIKHLFDGFKQVARRADVAISEAFDVSLHVLHCDTIKWADDLMLVHEANLLMVNGPGPASEPLPRNMRIRCWDPPLAEQRFLDKFKELS